MDTDAPTDLSDRVLLAVCLACWAPMVVGAIVWQAAAMGLIAGLFTGPTVLAGVAVWRDRPTPASDATVVMIVPDAAMEEPVGPTDTGEARLPGEMLSPTG